MANYFPNSYQKRSNFSQINYILLDDSYLTENYLFNE